MKINWWMQLMLLKLGGVDYLETWSMSWR